MILRIAPFCLLPLCIACGGDRGEDRGAGLPPGEIQLRDSAGVTIVEHGPLVVEDSTSWVLDPDAGQQIGQEEGDAEELFGRVAGFARLPGDRVIVGDGVGPWIRVYGPDGRFLETVGRPGSGPGEFLNLVGIAPHAGDSVAVVDFEGARWSVLAPDGRFVRVQRPLVRGWDRPGSSPSLFGFFADGTALVALSRPREVTELAVDRGTPVNLEVIDGDFLRVDADGEILARFGTHNLMRSVVMRGEDGSFMWQGLAPLALHVVSGDRVYLADGGTGEIQVYRADGTLERIVRVELPESAMQPARVLEAFVESTRSRAPAGAFPGFERMVQATPLPHRIPDFGDLVVDPTGHLWARPFPAVPDEGSETVRWYVFDPDGVFARVVRLPTEFRAAGGMSPTTPPGLVIGEGWILARTRGALGEETIRFVPLRKDAAPRVD